MSQAKSITVNLAPGLTLLTVVFVLLRAFDKIDWPWWQVLAPTWIPIALGLSIMTLGVIIAIVAAILK